MSNPEQSSSPMYSNAEFGLLLMDAHNAEVTHEIAPATTRELGSVATVVAMAPEFRGDVPVEELEHAYHLPSAEKDGLYSS